MPDPFNFSNPLPESVKNQAAKSSQKGLNLAPFGTDPSPDSFYKVGANFCCFESIWSMSI